MQLEKHLGNIDVGIKQAKPIIVSCPFTIFFLLNNISISI